MEDIKIILEDGTEKLVNAIFYLFDGRYYFIYTEKQLDENGYVILHIVKVGKEIKNTPDGPLDTGYMVGVEITDQEEWAKVQQSISTIVEDKKNKTVSPTIQYIETNLLSTLKITGKKTFKLKRDVIEDNFGVKITESPIEIVPTPTLETINPILTPTPETTPIDPVNPALSTATMETPIENVVPVQPIVENSVPINQLSSQTEPIPEEQDVIIDYRAKFFEEQEKNNELVTQINELTTKLNNIKDMLG